MKTPTVNARPIYYAVPEPDMPGCDYGLEPLPARAGFFEVRRRMSRADYEARKAEVAR